MGLREDKREALRRHIRSCAITLFEERGYDGATVDAIAQAAQVSLPTLFRYFPSKADLLMGDDEAIVDAFERIVSEVEPGETLLDVLRRAVANTAAFTEDEGLAHLRAELVALHPELRRRQLDLDDRAVRRVAAAITRRLALDPRDPRPRALAAATHGIVRAAMETWRDEPDGRTFAEVVDTVFDLLPEVSGLLGR